MSSKSDKIRIVVASGKGGVGKSMFASVLAMLFPSENTVAADCDVDAPNLAIWLNQDYSWLREERISTVSQPKIDERFCQGCGRCAKYCRFQALEMTAGRPRLNHFACEGCGVCELVCPHQAIKLQSVENAVIKSKKTDYGFPLYSGQLFPGQSTSGKVVAEVKKRAEREFKQSDRRLMIIDSAPGTGCPVIASCSDAQFAVLITEPTPSGLADLEKVLAVVDYFGLEYGVVVNKFDLNPEMTEKISRRFSGKIIGRISYQPEVFQALADFTPLLETDLAVKKEVEKIFQELNNRWQLL